MFFLLDFSWRINSDIPPLGTVEMFIAMRYNHFDVFCGSGLVVKRLLAKEKIAGSSPVSRSDL